MKKFAKLFEVAQGVGQVLVWIEDDYEDGVVVRMRTDVWEIGYKVTMKPNKDGDEDTMLERVDQQFAEQFYQEAYNQLQPF